jgi:chromosome segregation ATPase
MPEVSVECPFCGQKTIGGRYCKSCGRPLPEQREQESYRGSPSTTSGPGSNKENPETGPQPGEENMLELGISLDGSNSRMLGVLLARAELRVIGEGLDRLISEIEATRQALRLEHADRDVLAPRTLNLKEAFEKTKNRHAQLTSVKGSLPLEKIADELTIQESKLSKLNKMKRSIDTDVYREEHERIVFEIEKLKANLKETADESRDWLKTLNKRLGELRRESSRLEARFRIGDLAAGPYEDSKLRVDRSIRILEEGQELLKSMLTAAQRKQPRMK